MTEEAPRSLLVYDLASTNGVRPAGMTEGPSHAVVRLTEDSPVMLGHFELLAAIPAASGDCDDVVSVDDAYLVEISKHDEGAMGPVVRNGVVVEVEASVRRLSDLDFDSLVRGKGLRRQSEQSAALVLERLSHRARSVFDPRPIECRRRRPL